MGSIEGGDKNKLQIFAREIKNDGSISGGDVTLVAERYSGEGRVTSYPPNGGNIDTKKDWPSRWFGKIITGVLISVISGALLYFLRLTQ